MSANEKPLPVAVVIATNNRLHLLAARAIPSLIAQTRAPDLLVVVDDSDAEVRAANAEFVRILDIPGCEISYLENARTIGASGSWNTAIDHVMGRVGKPSGAFMAILDDDDSWSPEYLERCCATACNQNLDMVASDLRRFESVDGDPILIESPSSLRAEDFLIGNPGIQGSNLFVRLSVMLAAGGFDEALPSTTDRDLCIRIADIGTVRYGRLPVALVNHFADSGRPRLSIRGSQTKLAGLTAFWLKYFGRMTVAQRDAFKSRATALFAWQPSADPTIAPAASRAIGKAPACLSFHLIVGVITSEPSQLKPFLTALAPLRSTACLHGLSVLILDNGCPREQFATVVRKAREAGLQVAIIDEARQRQDAAAGSFGATLRDRPSGQAGIARARTMLQRYLGAMMETEPGSIGWLLDDDMRVDDRARNYLAWLPSFRAAGVDVLLGAYEGSSPNPPLNGLRVHLVDLVHNLYWLRSLPSDSVLPDRTAENAALRERYPDYYYDLSRKHTAHLEMPHWLEPCFPGETVSEGRSRLLTEAVGLLNGAPLTRAIVTSTPIDPLAAAVDSVNRGGHTFVLNPHALTQTPNMTASVQGQEARRSDMFWAIANRNYRRQVIKAVGFPVLHVARWNGAPRFGVEKARAELIGSTLCAGLTEFLRKHQEHDLIFTRQELDEVCSLADLYLSQRWRMLEQSFHRIIGLRESLRRAAQPDEFEELLRHLDGWFAEDSFDHLRSEVGTHRCQETRDFLASLRPMADDFSALTVSIDFIQEQLRDCSPRTRHYFGADSHKGAVANDSGGHDLPTTT